MEYRRIGVLQVSVLGLGTSRLASLGTRHSHADVERLLGAAADAGMNFIDTSDTYGSGACERVLGEVLGAFGSAGFCVATKGGLAVTDLPRPFRFMNQVGKKALVGLGRRHDVRPGSIARRIDASLGRLRRETIDMYFLHAPPMAAVRDEALLEVLRGAVTAGKVRLLGVSSDDPAVVGAAAASGAFQVVQTSAGRIPLDAGGAAVIANQVQSSAGPAALATAARVAAERRTSRLSVLLRNAAAHPATRSVLVGTADPAHLREDAAAFELPVTGADLLEAVD